MDQLNVTPRRSPRKSPIKTTTTAPTTTPVRSESRRRSLALKRHPSASRKCLSPNRVLSLQSTLSHVGSPTRPDGAKKSATDDAIAFPSGWSRTTEMFVKSTTGQGRRLRASASQSNVTVQSHPSTSFRSIVESDTSSLSSSQGSLRKARRALFPESEPEPRRRSESAAVSAISLGRRSNSAAKFNEFGRLRIPEAGMTVARTFSSPDPKTSSLLDMFSPAPKALNLTSEPLVARQSNAMRYMSSAIELTKTALRRSPRSLAASCFTKLDSPLAKDDTGEKRSITDLDQKEELMPLRDFFDWCIASKICFRLTATQSGLLQTDLQPPSDTELATALIDAAQGRDSLLHGSFRRGLLQTLVHWAFPVLPTKSGLVYPHWTASGSLPLESSDKQAASPSHADESRVGLLKMWKEAIQSVWQMVGLGHCPFVYMLTQHWTALFISDSNGLRIQISMPPPGLCNVLDSLGIAYSLYRLPRDETPETPQKRDRRSPTPTTPKKPMVVTPSKPDSPAVVLEESAVKARAEESGLIFRDRVSFFRRATTSAVVSILEISDKAGSGTANTDRFIKDYLLAYAEADLMPLSGRHRLTPPLILATQPFANALARRGTFSFRKLAKDHDDNDAAALLDVAGAPLLPHVMPTLLGLLCARLDKSDAISLAYMRESTTAIFSAIHCATGAEVTRDAIARMVVSREQTILYEGDAACLTAQDGISGTSLSQGGVPAIVVTKMCQMTKNALQKA